MSEILSAAAAALGIPEALAQRSAAARSAETGATVEEVLAAWAGGAQAPQPAAASATTAPAPVEVPDAAAPPPAPPATVAPAVIASPAPVAAATGRAPLPDQVTPGEASHLPEVITVPTAGIKERTNFVIPRWLTAVLVIAPLFALFALGGSATGECGEATELRADVVTGKIVNCDGSAFTGQQIGGGDVDYIAVGGEIYAGSGVVGVNCASCHGAGGQGVGNFPALTGVMTTFGACADHEQWVSIGSAAWPDATYGDTNKPVGVGMPGFASSLTEEQLAAVVAFERARFGGGDQGQVLADCGLLEPESGEGTTEGGGAPEATAGYRG